MTTARAEREEPGARRVRPAEHRRIEKFREKFGLDWPYTRWTTWNEEATRTASGTTPTASGTTKSPVGRPEHAARAAGGGVIAPPGFLEGAGLTPKLPRRPEDRAGAGRCRACTCSGRLPHPLLLTRCVRVTGCGCGGSTSTSRRSSPLRGRSALTCAGGVLDDRGELIAIWDADFVTRA